MTKLTTSNRLVYLQVYTMSTSNEKERGEQELDKVQQRFSEALFKATHQTL